MAELSPLTQTIQLEPQYGDAGYWGTTTDPANHDPDNFRYHIHGTGYALSGNPAPLETSDAYRDPRDTEPGWEGDQSINLVQHPELAAGRLALSTSLISPERTTTWTPAGLILKVPRQNVISASSGDLGIRNGDPLSLRYHAKRRIQQHGPIPTPDSILADSEEGKVNEIVALGTRGESQVQLAGFYYKKSPSGLPVDRRGARQIRAHAKRLNLPVVPIKSQERFRSQLKRETREYLRFVKGKLTQSPGRKAVSEVVAPHRRNNTDPNL